MRLSEIKMEMAADKGAELHLLHPVTEEPLFTDDKKPMVIRLVGIDSKQYRKASAKIGDRELKKRKKSTTMEKARARGTELLAACTIGWNIQIDKDKPCADFSTDAAEKLYSDMGWIREEVDEFIGERSNFLQIA